MPPARVVILGGGFAGVGTARALGRIGKKHVDVTLVSRDNYLLFTPMLPEVAGGSLAARDIMQPLRVAFGDDGGARFELGEAVGVDLERRTVTLRHPVTNQTQALEYDQLVMAVGATESTMGVPGVQKFALGFKTIADAQAVRERVVGALEAAAKTRDLIERDRLLRFVVVGGDFTGVELAGELQGFLASVLRYYPDIDAKAVEMVVLESGDRLLSRLPEKFGKYAASVLSHRGVKLMLERDVSAIDTRGVELKGGERVASATVMWAAGEKPSPLAEILGLKTNKHGAVETGGDFAVSGAKNVWALGDCAAVPQPGGGTYAPLAQNAIREAPLLAKNIVASIHGKPTRNFRYREMGQMASLGNRQAVVELPGGRMITGFPAWLIWRAYYLGRLPGIAQKTRVALDWTLGLAFPPKTSRLSLIETEHKERAASR